MKPSERISEIQRRMILEDDFMKQTQYLEKYGTTDKASVAIMIFLDEEYEKNQPCKHEEIENHFCKKCNCLIAN